MSRLALARDGLLLLVWASCVSAALWLAAQTSPYLPKFDDWPTMTPLLARQEAFSVGWLWAPLNVHRIPIPRLAYLASFYLSGGDFRAAQFLSALLLGLAAAAGMGLARRWRDHSSIWDAAIPMLLLHWGQAHLFLLGSVLNFTVSLTLGYLALFLCLRSGEHLTRARAGMLFGCLAGMIFSGMTGILAAAPLIAWAGWLGVWHIRRGTTAGWSLVGGAVGLTVALIICLNGLGIGGAGASATGPAWPQRGVNLGVTLAMSLGWLGRAYFVGALCAVLGLTGAAVATLLLVSMRQPEDRWRCAALAAFLAGTGLNLMALQLGRAFIAGEELWATTRYAALAVPLLITTFFTGLLLRRHDWWFQAPVCALAGTVFVGHLLHAGEYPYDRDLIRFVGRNEERLVRGLLGGRPVRPLADQFFRYENGYTDGAKWLEMLQTAHLGPFDLSDRQKRVALGGWRPSGNDSLDLRSPASEAALGDGWALPCDSEGRWTVDRQAVVWFAAAPEQHDLVLRLFPFVVPGRVDCQRVKIAVNGAVVKELALSVSDWADVVVPLPPADARPLNTLELLLPDAVSPLSVGYNVDDLPHGILVRSLRVR
jgi:hypothetical protein